MLTAVINFSTDNESDETPCIVPVEENEVSRHSQPDVTMYVCM